MTTATIPLPRMRIGEMLVAAGTTTPSAIAEALEAQSRFGGRIGEHLVLAEALSRRSLISAIAAQHGIPFIDLVEDPPVADPRANADWRQAAHRRWLIHRVEGRRVLAVTSRPPRQDVIAEVAAWYPGYTVELAMTTWWDIEQAIAADRRAALVHAASAELAESHPELSAKSGQIAWNARFVALATTLLVGLSWFFPRVMFSLGLLLSSAMLTGGFLFKMWLCTNGLKRQAKENAWQKAVEDARKAGVGPTALNSKFARASMGRLPLADHELPKYTVLVPAYKEDNIIANVLTHIGELDYPKNKLEVMILLEESDTATIAAARAARPPDYVHIVVVPDGQPRTKPRACNYGLALATGEFLVIYDAEDRPEAGQLRGVVEDFRYQPPEIICVQSRLNYWNSTQNMLTRMFTLEYTAWFDSMLPGLVEMKMPIPLGGTSNHFRTDGLRELGGWDPYNVTEDADLGLRASVLGWGVDVTATTTWEEACSEVGPWIRQRTRWLKGYLMTTLVQIRNTRAMTSASQNNVRLFATLFGLIATTPLSFMAYLPSWAITIAGLYGFPKGLNQLAPGWLFDVAFISMAFGTIGAVVLVGASTYMRFGWRLALLAPLMPLYWCLHGVAAWRAFYQLLRDPFTWEKTPHGLTSSQATGRRIS